MFIMGKAQTELTELKCRDCCKCDNAGRGQHFCDQTALPIDANGPACISVLPKLSARERRESLTK